ncbi:MAG: hypothetical protein A2W91_08140 [Bacteroidetes bacterium GWF2_38_335]|nr:MAG: hypothetical protein A2W91_08140 [Bacteroidetes bacterium GWF2_38_335]OFY78986.1 MAG: hypothetical protein A2281_02580 [Bacteroidetes bacterium RIFOXYA12_FULL_38_20]HBS86057.1 hypothetical protein [Bacteroidales bacterium]
MKTIKILSLLIAVMFVSVLNAQDSKEVKEIKFKSNVECNNCKSKIENHMAFVKGVKSVDASIDKKEVTITYKPEKTNAEEIKTELAKLGYGAEMIGEAGTGEKKSCAGEEGKSCCPKKQGKKKACNATTQE